MFYQKKSFVTGVAFLLCFACLVAVMGFGLTSISVYAEEEKTAENLALQADVMTDSEWLDPEGFWNSLFINDGHKLLAWPIPEDVEDGTLGWRSSAYPEREVDFDITLDLGGVATINKVVLYPRGSAICFPDDYAIEVSADGMNWTQVASKTGDTEVVAEARELSFEAVEAQYVSLVVTKLSEEKDGIDSVCEISEMEVWGIMPDPTPTPEPTATPEPTKAPVTPKKAPVTPTKAPSSADAGEDSGNTWLMPTIGAAVAVVVLAVVVLVVVKKKKT